MAMATERRSSKWIVLAIAGSGVFMATLDQGIVTLALPTIGQVFQTPILVTQWVVLGYALCLTGLLLPIGRLSDMIGRKRVFLTGFVIFTLASGVSGLAPSLSALIATSLLKGVGGAMMQANTPGLITQAFPASQRGRALGFNAAIVSAGLLCGPIVGGLILNWLGWRWIYFVNVPIGIIATFFGLRLLQEPARQPNQHLDLAGSLLLPLLLSGGLIWISLGGQLGWQSPLMVSLALLVVIVGVAFTLIERRVPQPIFELALFRRQGFRTAVFCLGLLFLGISHSQLLLPYYLQQVLGYSPAQVGLILVSIPAAMLLLAPVAGALADRFGIRLLASAGLLGVTLGLLSLVTLQSTSTAWEIVGRLLLIGVGTAFFQAPNSSALFGAMPRERYGIGGAYQALTRNLGQTVGQTWAGVIWTVAVVSAAGGGSAASAPAEAQMAGFRLAFLVAAVLTGIGVILSLLARPSGVDSTPPTTALSESAAAPPAPRGAPEGRSRRGGEPAGD